MSDSNQTIGLWMPVLNEIQGLKVIFPMIDQSLFTEIVVIDGGSTDGSVEYCQQKGIKVLRQPSKGMPDASEFAFEHTTSDIIIIFTPDGNSLAEVLPTLCNKMREGYDMVIASRYLNDAGSLDDGFITSFGNKLFTNMVNFLFRSNYTDVLVAYRGYKRSAIQAMRLANHTNEHWLRNRFFYMNGWELGSAIRAAKMKMKVTEIPADEPKRIGGRSKLSIFKNGSGSLLQIIHDFVHFRA